MLEATMSAVPSLLAETTFSSVLNSILNWGLIFIGFSMVIFVHELGHFAVAKWCGIRVEKFAIGFGKELAGFTRGETRYSFNLLPLGGYVKMLGQEDFTVDESGEWKVKGDPRSFTSKPVFQRMAVVSAGVIMNVLFAALLFMIVFMAGMPVIDGVVGLVLPGTPAEDAGLQSGDRVLAIDGDPIEEFLDIKMAVVLSSPGEAIDMQVERKEGLLFRIDTAQADVASAQRALEQGRITDALRKAFADREHALSSAATAVVDRSGSRWRILDGEQRFIAVQGASGLGIYEAKVYTIPIIPRHDESENMQQIGIGSPFTQEVLGTFPKPEFLVKRAFILDASLGEALDARSVSDALRTAFSQHETALAEDAAVLVYDAGNEWQIISAGRAYTIQRADDALHVYRDKQPRAKDTVVRVGGHEETARYAIINMVKDAGGEPVEFVVERPDPADPTVTYKVTCYSRGRMRFLPAGKPQRGGGSLLGLVPRRRILYVEPESPGEEAGFKLGDVVAAWGEIAHPTWAEIRKINEGNAGRDITVRVRRGETEETLTLRPKTKWKPFGDDPPIVGLRFEEQEQDRVVVAMVREMTADDKPTPAAALQMPRGSTILSVDDEPVRTWRGLVARFRQKAGSSVAITYRYGDDEPKIEHMQVPASMTTSLEDADGQPVTLPISASILSVAGQQTVKGKTEKGEEKPYSVKSVKGLRLALAQHVGETVEIRYYDHAAAQARAATMQVTAENVDPWLRRVTYDHQIEFRPQIRILKKTNPLAALAVGMKKTYFFIINAYKTIKAMLWTRTIGMEHISGPVGIANLGAMAAEAGMVSLFFFLGMLSANLAVINFLPLPIVDGGLMIFLMIEKLKGSPVSLKTQVVTQIIGLALIISVFVYVTVADIAKLL